MKLPKSIDRFLEFLDQTMIANTEGLIVALPASIRERMAALVGDIEVNLEGEIHGDVALDGSDHSPKVL